jgi:methylated-DNA-[protein]-cysteine S-methyltransferase
VYISLGSLARIRSKHSFSSLAETPLLPEICPFVNENQRLSYIIRLAKRKFLAKMWVMANDQDILYSIFKTSWGWFGLLGTEKALLRTCLPVAFKEAVQRRLLDGIDNAIPAKKMFKSIEKDISDYYKGSCVDFGEIEVGFDGLTDFQQKVLSALRNVSYGRTVSYGQLARLADCPRGGRAIGTVMSLNPLPLIVPCHRVIRADGSLGYFSAAGGVDTKQKMLNLEKT